jgi:ketosteroid isomerase-like protein
MSGVVVVGLVIVPSWRRLARRGPIPDFRHAVWPAAPGTAGAQPEGEIMTDPNEALVREAYQAYERGDVARMLEFVDPDLEWTYLDPSLEDPSPEICHGREQLRRALERQAEQGLASQVEEIAVNGNQVMVVTRTAGIDRVRVRQADDRNYLVLTLGGGRIVKMRACRDRDEAHSVAAIS